MLLGPLDAPLHEGADGRGRSVENRHAILLDNAPEPVRLGEVWRAFVHQAGRTVRQRAIDHVAVPGDPADVRCAPEDVLVAQIEDVFGSELGVEQIAAGGVQDALRLADRKSTRLNSSHLGISYAV